MKTKEQKRREACDRIKRSLVADLRLANSAAFSGDAVAKERAERRVQRMQAEIAQLESMSGAATRKA
jgi:hypothetical protein